MKKKVFIAAFVTMSFTVSGSNLEEAAAIFNEAENCFFGIGRSEDQQKAIKLYEEAAELGYAEAQFRLGVCYSDGDGVDRDLSKAFYWYKKAYEKGTQ